MNDTTLSASLALPNQALLFDLDALYACLQTVPDHRDRRGVRYPLASLLLIGVLAKLAGQESSRGIAHWAHLRRHELASLFHLKRERMPHFSTWSRVLGHAVTPEDVEEIVGRFFAQAVRHTQDKQPCIQLAIDGKTLRGTIPLGESHGVHLVAAYLPQEGVVLGQVQASNWGSEPGAASRLVANIDLRGMVVTGDAIFASRPLSTKIVQAKADYLWMMKENQKQMYQDIQTLFEPQSSRLGRSAPPTDFRLASSLDKGHGRLEKRRITVSSLLASYSQWPALWQVFQVERERTNALGETQREVQYGITSLSPAQASPQRLLQLVRDHWGIENGLHYRRDRTFDEDRSQLRMGHAPQVLALLNNTAISLFARRGETNLPHAQRTFDYQFDKALARLTA
jgi:predicted transposase YbfD/YdcC